MADFCGCGLIQLLALNNLVRGDALHHMERVIDKSNYQVDLDGRKDYALVLLNERITELFLLIRGNLLDYFEELLIFEL